MLTVKRKNNFFNSSFALVRSHGSTSPPAAPQKKYLESNNTTANFIPKLIR